MTTHEDLQRQPVNRELLLRNIVDSLTPQAQKSAVTLTAHDGKIWVESRPGQGSVFVVKLPVTKPDDKNLKSKNRGKL